MLAGRRSRAGGQVQPLQQRLHLKAALVFPIPQLGLWHLSIGLTLWFSNQEAANDPGGASLPLLSSFHRLLAHGICEYHGLKSVSREAPGTSNRITHFQRRPDNAEPHEIRVSDVLFLLSEESMGRFGPAGTGPGANANDDFRVSGSHGRSDYENTHGVGGSSMLQPASGGAYGDWVIV